MMISRRKLLAAAAGMCGVIVLPTTVEAKPKPRGELTLRPLKVGDYVRFSYHPSNKVAKIITIEDNYSDLAKNRRLSPPAEMEEGRAIWAQDINNEYHYLVGVESHFELVPYGEYLRFPVEVNTTILT